MAKRAGRYSRLTDGVLVGVAAGLILAVSQGAFNIWNEQRLNRNATTHVADLFTSACQSILIDGDYTFEETEVVQYMWQEARNSATHLPHLLPEQRAQLRRVYYAFEDREDYLPSTFDQLRDLGWDIPVDCPR